jgi:hypothetical protein
VGGQFGGVHSFYKETPHPEQRAESYGMRFPQAQHLVPRTAKTNARPIGPKSIPKANQNHTSRPWNVAIAATAMAHKIQISRTVTTNAIVSQNKRLSETLPRTLSSMETCTG